MQLFLDTASLDAIRRWRPFGVVDGVTTNPALLAKEGGHPLDQLQAVAELVEGPVSAQVTHTDAAGMIRQGRALSELAPNVVVKIPATFEGHHAARVLTDEGVDCNVTLTFQAAQAIPFARIPVAYVSLILGRVEDFGLDGSSEVERARTMLDRLESPTRLLVASLRNPGHLCTALAGADVVTVPPTTWEGVYQNPLSLQGLEDFLRAWDSLDEDERAAFDELGRTTQPVGGGGPRAA